MATRPPEPGFWHCPRCRTPNPRAGYVATCLGCGAPRPVPDAGVTHKPTVRAQPVQRVRGGLLGLRERGSWLVRRAAAALPRLAFPARRGLLFWLSLGFAAELLALLVLTRTLGDSWFPATLLLYSPRVAWLIPLPILAIWAGFARNRSLLAFHLATLLCLAWPWVGLNVPVSRLLGSDPDALSRVRILSFNAHDGENLAVSEFVGFLDRERIDVVCFQEWGREGVEIIPDLAPYFENWHWDEHGYIVSRLAIVSDHLAHGPSRSTHPKVSNSLLGWVTVEDRFGNEFDVVNLYFESIRGWFSELVIVNFAGMSAFEERRRRDVASVVATLSAHERPTLIAGDFNTPADSPLFRPFRRYQEGFEAAGWGSGATFPSGMPWMGLDHILADGAWRVRQCRVIGALGSDHRPLEAELDLLRLRPPGR